MKKIILLSIILCSLAPVIPSSLFAQISTSWTSNMPAKKIPTGVTLNDTDTLTGYNVIKTIVDLDATTYDNATLSTAFNAIGDGVKAYIDTTLNYMGLDSTIDIVMVYVITNIDRRWDDFDHPDPIYQYGVATDIFRCWVTCKYKLP